jgi:glycosyltransferase involved in cell wall biosynthesis
MVSPVPGATDPELSVVVPMRNEIGGLDPLLARLLPALAATGVTYEIICVDDGSDDGTWERLRALAATIPGMRARSLSRNFGKEIAVVAGLERARGRAVVIIDADLQQPPEAIPDLLREWRAGFKIVHARRQGYWLADPRRRFATDAFYQIYNRLSEFKVDPLEGDFMLLDRQVVDAFLSLPERHRFNRGLIAWLGFRSTTVSVAAENRHAGASQWAPPRLVRHAVHAMISFGSFPLRVWTYLGLFATVSALLIGVAVLVRVLVFGDDAPLYPSLFVAILLSTGIQLMGLGMIGEYIGKIYAEVKRRPLYAVAEEAGFSDERAGSAPTSRPDVAGS